MGHQDIRETIKKDTGESGPDLSRRNFLIGTAFPPRCPLQFLSIVCHFARIRGPETEAPAPRPGVREHEDPDRRFAAGQPEPHPEAVPRGERPGHGACDAGPGRPLKGRERGRARPSSRTGHHRGGPAHGDGSFPSARG